MSCAAIVAVRESASAKSRLATSLGAATRIRLVQTMLEGVLHAVGSCAKISEVVLVTPQPREVDRSISVVIDAAQGLSRAFEAGCEHAAARGHRAAMLLPADLPLVTVNDLEALIEVGCRSGAALASDRAGAGTNGLYLPLPLPFELAYGSGSSLLHAAACTQAGLIMSLLERPGLSFDVDNALDLEGLAGYEDFKFLSEWERAVAC